MSKAKRPATKTLKEELATASIGKLSDSTLLEELQKRGHRVLLEPQEGAERHTKVKEVKDKHRFKFAVASDWHLGSRYQQLSHLKSFLAYAAKQKVDFAIMPGDVFDGHPSMHRGMVYEQFVHGADAMMNYALENIPKSPFPVYTISGNHDWTYFKDSGHNVVKAFCSQKEGFIHAGDMGTNLHLGPLNLYIWHPRGGISYARSYRMQRWINDRPPNHRPHIVLGGHFHVDNYLGDYGGVHGFQLSCFQSQTPFLKELGLTPVVGGLILEVTLGDDGSLRGLKQDWRKYPSWITDDY